MPTWLIQIILTLASQFGLPLVLKLFPKLPADVVAKIIKFLEDLALHREQKKALVAEAKENIAACYGPDCKEKT